jgi:hypothetical protein
MYAAYKNVIYTNQTEWMQHKKCNLKMDQQLEWN